MIPGWYSSYEFELDQHSFFSFFSLSRCDRKNFLRDSQRSKDSRKKNICSPHVESRRGAGGKLSFVGKDHPTLAGGVVVAWWHGGGVVVAWWCVVVAWWWRGSGVVVAWWWRGSGVVVAWCR